MAKDCSVKAIEIEFRDKQMLRLNPALAKEIGLNESIIFLQIQFLIRNSQNEKEGKRWTYQTLEKLETEYFPFLSRGSIDRAIASLKAQGLLIVANYNTRQSDRTRWFAINEENAAKLSTIIISQNEKSFPILESPFHQNGKSISQIGPTLPETSHRLLQREIPEPDENVTDGEELLHAFREEFLIQRKLRYRNSVNDQVQLAVCRGFHRPTITDWRKAMRNYFSSPRAKYTLTDFCDNYETFFNTALDRFKIPVANQTRMTANGAEVPKGYMRLDDGTICKRPAT